MQDWKEGLKVTGVIILVLFAVSFIWMSYPINYIVGKGKVTSIEQLREDIKNVSVNESEDVMGQVTEYNQYIKKSQYYNSIPIVELYIPDFWDEVKLIKIPKRNK